MLHETKPCSLQDILFWQGYVIPLHNTITVPKSPTGLLEPICVPGPLDPLMLPESETPYIHLQTLHAIFTGLHCLLLSPSFSLPTFLTPYFMMSLAHSWCWPAQQGALYCPMPPDMFLTALTNAALLQHIVTILDKPLQKWQALCFPILLK